MKRMFRVKESNGNQFARVGDVGELVGSHITDRVHLKNTNWHGMYGGWWFDIGQVEELPPVFEPGDEVRVKAGQWYALMELPVGKKHVASRIEETCGIQHINGHEVRRFEPWNPAEEWNGSAWVKKAEDCDFSGLIGKARLLGKQLHEAKSAIVINRKPDGQLHPATHPHVHASTDAARAEASRLAEQHKGEEFVVYQEAGSERREKPKSMAEELAVAATADFASNNTFTYSVGSKLWRIADRPTVSVNGDVVTVQYRVKP